MSDIILLGAGASIEANVPGAFDMTKEIIKMFDENYPDHSRILKFAVGGLLFQNGVKGRNPFEGVNIEDLFSTIQMLSKKHVSEISPFVSSWNPLLSELDKISEQRRSGQNLHKVLYQRLSRDLSKHLRNRTKEIDKAVDEYIKASDKGWAFGRQGPGRIIYEMLNDTFKGLASSTPLSSSEFAREMERMIYGDENDAGHAFNEVLELMMYMLVDLVWIEDRELIKYLLPLVDIPNDTSRTIVSLNYDNAIELAASQLNVQVDTGIVRWSESGEFTLNDKGINLLKLHGSIDWNLKSIDGSLTKPLPYSVIEQISSEEIKESGIFPAVIFGQRNKLTAQGPFLDLMRSFKTVLSQTNLLTVIGYSFRDDHINEFIKDWLNGDIHREMRIINGPNFPNGQESSFLQTLLAKARNRVNIIQKNASEGIAQCFVSRL